MRHIVDISSYLMPSYLPSYSELNRALDDLFNANMQVSHQSRASGSLCVTDIPGHRLQVTNLPV